MILRIEELKDLCTIILPAVDSTDFSSLTDTLELHAHNGQLDFSITNKEYFLETFVKIDDNIDFRATVNANLFVKLISQTTTDTLEFTVDSQSLVIKGNGKYKLPLIYDGDELFKLPRIDLTSNQGNIDIDGNILYSIFLYNTKQLSVGTLSRPVQKLYYVDSEGCITFTSGACVNKFSINTTNKLLFNQRLVKLFKLFKDKKVNFVCNVDKISPEITQTKVKFESGNIILTAILPCDDATLQQVPVKAIRNRAFNTYKYSVMLNKQFLIDTISRIKLFVADSRAVVPYAEFKFSNDSVTVSDLKHENNELLYYLEDVDCFKDDEVYTMYLDLNEVLAILDTCIEQHVNFNFGDGQALIVKRSSVVNIIPEVKID